MVPTFLHFNKNKWFCIVGFGDPEMCTCVGSVVGPTDPARDAAVDSSQCLETIRRERDESATCHVTSLFPVVDLRWQEAKRASQKGFCEAVQIIGDGAVLVLCSEHNQNRIG